MAPFDTLPFAEDLEASFAPEQIPRPSETIIAVTSGSPDRWLAVPRPCWPTSTHGTPPAPRARPTSMTGRGFPPAESTELCAGQALADRPA